MAYYAVIDTNVLLSALLTKNPEAATVRVIDAVFKSIILQKNSLSRQPK